MGAFCLEVTAPKSVSLPTGPSELHRNPICCHWARPDRTETRFAASIAGTPGVFPDVEPCSIVEFLPVPPGCPPPLEPQRLLGPPTPALLDVGNRPARLLLERGARSSPAEEPISPRTVGAARTFACTSFAPAHRAPRCWGRGPCGTRAAWPVLHARAAVTAHARGPPSLGMTDGLSAVGCIAPLKPPGVHLLPKPSISQRHKFSRGLLQNEPPMEAYPVVAMPLP